MLAKSSKLPNPFYSVVAVFGSALLFAWIFLSNLSPSLLLSPTSSNIESSYFASLAGAALASLFICLMAGRVSLSVGYSTMPLLAALLAALTLAEALVSTLPDNAPLMAGLGLLNGICQPLLIIAWGARLTWEQKLDGTIVFASYTVAIVLFFGITELHPHFLATLITVLLPAISALLWCFDLRKRRTIAPELDSRWLDEKDNGDLSEMVAGIASLRSLSWPVLMILAFTMFLGDFITSTMLQLSMELSSGVTVVSFWLCLALCLCCLVIGMTRFIRTPIDSVARFLLPVIVLGMVSVLVFGTTQVSVGIIRSSGLFFGALVIQLIVSATKRDGLSPLLSFGLACALINIIEFFGHILGLAFYAVFGFDQQSINVIVGASIVIVVALALLTPTRLRTQSPSPEATDFFATDSNSPDSIMPSDHEHTGRAFNDKVERFSQKHKLSARETEVISLLLRGRSGPRIAEMLFVTSGTIKTHLKHIYSKLGASGRQDVMEMFDAF
jgi:DNA-binding CsgD family transcriptional regulator